MYEFLALNESELKIIESDNNNYIFDIMYLIFFGVIFSTYYIIKFLNNFILKPFLNGIHID